MSKSKYREGSAGAAQEKDEKRFLTVFSILFGIVLLLWILPFPVDSIVGFAHYYFTQAGVFWKVLAFISIGLHYYFIWVKLRDVENPVGSVFPPQAIYMFGWFALNLLLMSGFKFDLPPGA